MSQVNQGPPIDPTKSREEGHSLESTVYWDTKGEGDFLTFRQNSTLSVFNILYWDGIIRGGRGEMQVQREKDPRKILDDPRRAGSWCQIAGLFRFNWIHYIFLKDLINLFI